jgi:peptide/nickel transport system substrate-binding protein
VRAYSKQVKLLLALTVVAVGVAAGFLLRGGPEREGRADAIRPGGFLVSSLRAEPRTFNGYYGTDAASHVFTLLTQATLVRVNRVTHQTEPWLAESWTVDPDDLTCTLKLRTGVRFSDGTPFTSADVLFAFAAVQNASAGSPLSGSLTVGGKPLVVTAPDTSTVVVRFPEPYGPGVRILHALPVLPAHKLWPAMESGSLRTAWGPTTRPEDLAGLGPFVLHQYVPGERMVFARNPHYWRRDETGRSLPYLDRLVLDVVPDQNAEALRLETGQSDFLSSEIRPDDYPALKRAADAGRFRLIDLGVGLDPNFLWFNLDRSAKASDPRQAWMQHVALRRAVAHAVDRSSFADTVFLGAGVAVHGPITPGNVEWFSPSLPTYEYDPGRAGRLLESIDLLDRNGDGIREDPKGAAARFALLTQKGHTARERGAAVLQEDLRKIGLQVDVVALEVGSLVSRLMERDYDAIYFGIQTTDTDPASALQFWLSSGAFHAWNLGQKKPATEWEARIDQLMRQQLASPEPAERKRLFEEVQTIFATELPAMHFAAPRVFVALSDRVTNATPAVFFPQVLWNADVLASRSEH